MYACLKIFRDKFGMTLEETRDIINKNTNSIKISTMFISRFIKKMIRSFGEKDDEWDSLNEGDDDNDDSEYK